MNYGDKIWLEIYYDRNLVPLLGIIDSGPKWTATIAGSIGDIPVYPSELEFISKKDLTAKISEVENLSNRVNTIRTLAENEIISQFNSGFISEEEKTAQLEALAQSFDKIIDSITKYKQDMNQFFVAMPNAGFRRLFRTFTLIGYTTKNLDPGLDGIIASPPNEGTPELNGVNVASEDSSFKIVQAVTTDLLLADICYQNRYAARLPVPYHRPIYYFVHNNKDEELETTK